MSTSFDHVTLSQRVLFGTGHALTNVAIALGDLSATRVVIIASQSAKRLADSIAGQTPVVGRIHVILQHVPAENAAAATALVRRLDADVLLAIGGGSSTGLAKIVARDTGLPIVAVPTTFAGSEATNVWGITEHEVKTTGVSNLVLPRIVIYDAELMASMPTPLAVASGMNAAAHAIDGMWAPRADPINRAIGTEGLRALVPGLRTLHADPSSVEAREQTLYGAYLAAVAFASAGSGLHHKICHALGGTYGLPHAQTHAVMIPYVTAFNAPAAADASHRIASALDNGRSAAAGLYALCRELGLSASLQEIGFQRSEIGRAAELIFPSLPTSNPRPVSKPDLEALLESAWAGEPI